MIELETIEKAIRAARFADDKKAENIVVLDLRDVCTFTDAFVVCSGSTRLQLKAIADSISDGLREVDVRPGAVDGMRLGTWVVLDYGDFVVHVMSEEAREYYRLEDLWGDGQIVDWVTGTAAEPIAKKA